MFEMRLDVNKPGISILPDLQQSIRGVLQLRGVVEGLWACWNVHIANRPHGNPELFTSSLALCGVVSVG